ncbi:MAG TPA: hypothetical protein VJA66_15150 [Thermoanaerobaculia bacterium]
MTKRSAAFLLLLLFLVSVGPFGRAAFDPSSCCCPDNAVACPMHSSSCSFKSGCGSQNDADSATLVVFSLPETTSGPALPPARAHEFELTVSTLSRSFPVPDPPPRG